MTNNLAPELSKALFTAHFSEFKDPRRTNKGNFIYPLQEILFLVFVVGTSGLK